MQLEVIICEKTSRCSSVRISSDRLLCQFCIHATFLHDSCYRPYRDDPHLCN